MSRSPSRGEPGRRAATLAAVALLVAGCAAPRWVRVEGPWELPEVAVPAGAVGLGLARGPGGWQPRRCLAAFETQTSGGVPRVEARPLRRDLLPTDPALRELADRALSAAERVAARRRGPPPRGLLVTLRVRGQRTSLVEPSARFTTAARKRLDAGDAEGFLRLCGTEVVVSVVTEGSADVAVVWAPSTEEEARAMDRELAAGPGGPGDVLRLRALDGLPFDRLAFAAVRADARLPFAALPVPRDAGGSASALVAAALGAVLDAGRGAVVEVERRAWTTFADGRLLTPGRGDAPEPAERRLALLEALRERASLRLAQARALAGPQARGCEAAAEGVVTAAAPDRMAACAAAARAAGSGEIEGLGACAAISAALGRFDEDRACSWVARSSGAIARETLREESHRPLRLSARSSRAILPAAADAHASSDRFLVRGGPPAPPVGAATGVDGRGGLRGCVEGSGEEEDPGEPGEGGAAGTVDPQSDIVLVHAQLGAHGLRRWSLAKRLLLFWRRAPEPRVVWRGVLEAVGATRPAPAGAGPAPGTEDAAGVGAAALRARCGTHRVSLVVRRRGVVFYFSRGSDGDEEISVHPYGLGPEAMASPVLRPASATAFLGDLAEVARLLREGGHGVPEALVLEPWGGAPRERAPSPPGAP